MNDTTDNDDRTIEELHEAVIAYDRLRTDEALDRLRRALAARLKVTSDRDVRRQVLDTLGNDADAYDVDGITAEVVERYGLVDLDSIGPAHYWAIVSRHAVTP